LVACRLTTIGRLASTAASKAAAASISTRTAVSSWKALQAARSGIWPNAATGITAETGPGAWASRSRTTAGSSIQVSASTSTNQGVSPAWRTAWAVATKVQDGVAHSEPAGRSIAFRARVRAWVALTVVTTWAPSPKRCARRASNSIRSGPKFEYQRAVSMRCR
jgi:hypothetical protein